MPGANKVMKVHLMPSSAVGDVGLGDLRSPHAQGSPSLSPLVIGQHLVEIAPNSLQYRFSGQGELSSPALSPCAPGAPLPYDRGS